MERCVSCCRNKPAVKRFLLLLLLGIFWAPWDGRTAFAIFLFALFLRGWYAVREERLKPLLFAGGSALLIAVAFLYSADTGVYGSPRGCLDWREWRGKAAANRTNSRAMRLPLRASPVSLGVLALLINSIMATPLDFRFWRTSLALVGGAPLERALPQSPDRAPYIYCFP